MRNILFYLLVFFCHNLKGVNNTFLRFKQMAITDAKNAEKYLDFAENYIKLQEFRTKEGILNDNDGAFIDTNKLSKIDKQIKASVRRWFSFKYCNLLLLYFVLCFISRNKINVMIIQCGPGYALIFSKNKCCPMFTFIF